MIVKLLALPGTTSTNDVAKNLAAQGAPEGTVVVADEQTAGRGRLGRRWLAPPGTCLLCSILFRPVLPPAQAQRLTMLCSLAAADAVQESTGLQVWLKWPNDLVVQSQIANGKSANQQIGKSANLHPSSSILHSPSSILHSPSWSKLGGILTETGVIGERLEFVVVGIGINVNVEPDMLPSLAPDATSILAEVGRPVDRVALLAALLAGVERRYTALQAGENPHREWAARLMTLGHMVEVITSVGAGLAPAQVGAGLAPVGAGLAPAQVGAGLAPARGVAESVDEDGALLLRMPDGGLQRLLAGDVTLAHR